VISSRRFRRITNEVCVAEVIPARALSAGLRILAKRIGLLTSGVDCGGLNAVIRAVTMRAHSACGRKVLGIRNGSMGLLRQPPDAENLDPWRLGAEMMRLGAILGTTNRGDPIAFPMPDGSLRDRSREVIDAYHALRLDALIGVGGDGSFAILRRLAQQGGLPLVAIPKTIETMSATARFSVGYILRLRLQSRRSTGCSRLRRATTASWCSR